MKAIDIADAIVADLNDNFDAGGTPFVAERRWLPEYEASKLDKIVVCVVPRTDEVTLASRAHNTEVIVIDVAVMRRVDVLKIEECDEIANMAILVRDFLEDKQYVGTGRVGISQTHYANPAHLREHGVFQLLMTFMYKYVR